jgi:hypothetical protein
MTTTLSQSFPFFPPTHPVWSEEGKIHKEDIGGDSIRPNFPPPPSTCSYIIGIRTVGPRVREAHGHKTQVYVVSMLSKHRAVVLPIHTYIHNINCLHPTLTLTLPVNSWKETMTMDSSSRLSGLDQRQMFIMGMGQRSSWRLESFLHYYYFRQNGVDVLSSKLNSAEVRRESGSMVNLMELRGEIRRRDYSFRWAIILSLLLRPFSAWLMIWERGWDEKINGQLTSSRGTRIIGLGSLESNLGLSG